MQHPSIVREPLDSSERPTDVALDQSLLRIARMHPGPGSLDAVAREVAETLGANRVTGWPLEPSDAENSPQSIATVAQPGLDFKELVARTVRGTSESFGHGQRSP